MTTQRERAEAKERWRREQRHRALVETEIAKLEKQGAVTDAQLEDLGLLRLPLAPDLKFITTRLNELDGDDPQFDDKWHQVIIELVASDIPLSARTRSLIAGELRRLYFRNPARDHREKRRAEAWALKNIKRTLEDRGMTSAEAERAVAKSQNMTVDAMRKRIQRAKRKS